MNYQDMRKECSNLNQVSTDRSQTLSTINEGTSDIIAAYYKAKNDYVNARHEFNKQLKLRESKKRIDKINFSERLLHESFGKIQALRTLLIIIENTFNIKAEKSAGDYE